MPIIHQALLARSRIDYTCRLGDTPPMPLDCLPFTDIVTDTRDWTPLEGRG